jgi:hypothetical protein
MLRGDQKGRRKQESGDIEAEEKQPVLGDSGREYPQFKVMRCRLGLL